MPLKCFLPDGDVDLTAVFPEARAPRAGAAARAGGGARAAVQPAVLAGAGDAHQRRGEAGEDRSGGPGGRRQRQQRRGAVWAALPGRRRRVHRARQPVQAQRAARQVMVLLREPGAGRAPLLSPTRSRRSCCMPSTTSGRAWRRPSTCCTRCLGTSRRSTGRRAASRSPGRWRSAVRTASRSAHRDWLRARVGCRGLARSSRRQRPSTQCCLAVPPITRATAPTRPRRAPRPSGGSR